jgi:4-amino-4-deoxychorismate lyase
MKAWIDGRIAGDSASLRINGPAFRCGMGVFETVLHHGHRLPRFERHLERMRASLKYLGIDAELPPDDDLRRAVLDVALVGGLSGETARVNLFCYQDAPDRPTSLCITAVPHVLDRDAARSLAVYPHAHVSHLCAHKTMANMHQRLAWEYAQKAGMDDAVLTDAHGRVLEAACAALVFSDGHGFFMSDTPYKLPSLALEEAAHHVDIEPVEIGIGQLPSFKHAYWLNSLGGIQPVIRIDAVRYEPDWETCRPLMRDLLGLDDHA